MNTLKILLLVLTIGFSSPVPASLKCTKPYYPNTIKGGLQTTQQQPSAKVAVAVVGGDQDYNLQYVTDKPNIRKFRDKEFTKKVILSPACFLADPK